MPLVHDDQLHRKVMLKIVKGLSNTPMVLKGGTALYLRYGLTRHSEDLDFDSRLPLKLQNRVMHSLNDMAVIVNSVDVLKDTEVTQRYRLSYSHYLTPETTHMLKIETKFRDIPNENDVDNSKGFRVYKINKLIDQKLDAFENRTKPRDLYDVTFLAGRWGNEFSKVQADRLESITNDKDDLLQRYEQAWLSDRILNNTSIVSMVDRLSNSAQAVTRLSAQSIIQPKELTQQRKNDLGNEL